MIVTAQVAVPIVFAIFAWAIAGFGMGLVYTPQSLIVLAAAPEGGEGSATAALQLSEMLGVALGTGASGAIVAAGDALGWTGASTLTIAFAMCAVIALAGSAGAQRLPRMLLAR